MAMHAEMASDDIIVIILNITLQTNCDKLQKLLISMVSNFLKISSHTVTEIKNEYISFNIQIVYRMRVMLLRWYERLKPDARKTVANAPGTMAALVVVFINIFMLL